MPEEATTETTTESNGMFEQETPDVVATEETTEKVSESTEETASTENKGETLLTDAEEKVEIEYKLELGKESVLENSMVDEVKAFAKENNLTNEQAQSVLNKQDETVSRYLDQVKQAEDAQIDQWKDQVINDKVLGGDNLKSTTESARRVVERFGNEDFISLLRDTGYGNHPEIVRFLSNLGKTMAEDTLVLPKTETAGQKKSIEEVFYGTN